MRSFLALGCLCILTVAGEARTKWAALVVDANTGRTLHATNANARRYPASLTKLMTLYMVFEAMERGRAHRKTKIYFSARAAAAPPSKLGFKPGQYLYLHAAIRALIVKSANDVARAVAEHFAGSEARFARQMTRRAKQLGMRHTVFRNASGLPDRRQVTTARDMVRLAQRLRRDFPRYYHLFATRSFRFRGRRYRTHNKLLGRFWGADGLKTGYTRAPGFNLMTSAQRGRRRLIGVVFGARRSRTRNAYMRRILTKNFPRASTRRPRQLLARRKTRRPYIHRTRTAHNTRRPAPRTIGHNARPPSTLEAQAANLTTVRRVPTRLMKRRPKRLRRRGQAYHVQIGAFRSPSEARAALARARRQAPQLLEGFRAKTIAVDTAPNKTLYRSRFVGLAAPTATSLCNQLRQRAIDCYVTVQR